MSENCCIILYLFPYLRAYTDLKLEHVERTSDFLIEIMPLMFIPGGVGLVTAWGDLKDMILPVVVITIISTIVVMAVTGKATELIMKTGKKKEGKKDE